MSIEQAERALAELEAKETVTDEDLEAFIEQLPTDPEVARLVDAALPWPWSEVVEFVNHPTSPHWRPSSSRDHPNQRRAQREFARVAREMAGVQGTVERDGQRVGLAQAATGDALEGRRLSADRARATGQKALRRLRDVLGV